MVDTKEYSHGLFSMALADSIALLSALPASSRLLSFFAVQGHEEISSSCDVTLSNDLPSSNALRDDTGLKTAFLYRREHFFLRVRHAIVFAEVENFMSMTMFSTGIMCMLSQQIECLTIHSTSDLSRMLLAGSPDEQTRLSEMIQAGKLLITSRLPEAALAVRLAA